MSASLSLTSMDAAYGARHPRAQVFRAHICVSASRSQDSAPTNPIPRGV
jgi:hypothetical protein